MFFRSCTLDKLFGFGSKYCEKIRDCNNINLNTESSGFWFGTLTQLLVQVMEPT